MDLNEVLKQVRLIEIRSRKLVNQIFSGEYHSVFKGKGMTFSEVREYQFGDDIRNIDWNVTARFGHPYIKVFEEERELTLMLLVDASESLNFGTLNKSKIQAAAELSAVLAFSALKNNDKVGLIIFTDTVEKFIPPGKGTSHILRIIRELLSFKASGKKTNISVPLKFFNNAIKKKSICILISDFLTDELNYSAGNSSEEKVDPALYRIINSVNKKHDLVSISINDRFEREFNNPGVYSLIDSETGSHRIIDLTDKKTIRRIKQNFDELRKRKDYLFKITNVDNIDISINTDLSEDYLTPLIRFFKVRSKRW